MKERANQAAALWSGSLLKLYPSGITVNTPTIFHTQAMPNLECTIQTILPDV